MGLPVRGRRAASTGVGGATVGPPPRGSAGKTVPAWEAVRGLADEPRSVTIPPLTVTRCRCSGACPSEPRISYSRRPCAVGDALCATAWCLFYGRRVVDSTRLRRFFAVRPTQPLRSAFRRRPVRISSAVFGAVCGRSFPSCVRPAPWCSPARRVEGFSSDHFPVRGGGSEDTSWIHLYQPHGCPAVRRRIPRCSTAGNMMLVPSAAAGRAAVSGSIERGPRSMDFRSKRQSIPSPVSVIGPEW